MRRRSNFRYDANPPFFAMGETGAPVNIWMWKSERQADLDVAYQDLERAYPNLGIDSYPNLMRSAVEQPDSSRSDLAIGPDIRHRLGRWQYRLGSGAPESVEDLTAQGFGTLKADRELTRKSTPEESTDTVRTE